MRRIWRWLDKGRLAGLILLAGLLAVRIADPGPVQATRFAAFDLYQQMQPRVAARMPVAIIDIDDSSLAELGQWPWPRSLVARLVDAAAAAGAVAIAFDIVFAEPDRMSPDRIAAALPRLPADLALALAGLPANDAMLAAAMQRTRVVVGQSSVRSALTDRPDNTEIRDVPHAVLGANPTPFLLHFPDIVQNLPLLEQAAAGRAVFSLRPDADGIYRRLPLVMLVQDRVRLGLAPELLRVATGGDAFAIHSNDAGIDRIVVGGQAIATDANGLVWPHFSPSSPDRFVSAADLLAGRMVPDRLSGHMLFLGTSAIGLEDFRPTPLGVPMAGVEFHAQLLENILSGSLLHRPNHAIGTELVTVALIGAAIVLLVPVLGAAAIITVTLVSLTAYVAFSYWLFAARQSLLDPTFPGLALLLTMMLMATGNYLREERQRRQIRSAFGQYVSPELVAEMQDHPEALRLGGETRELSVLFTDVRRFTSIAESHRKTPEALTALMNRLLTTLSRAVLAEAGTIDKFMGDAVMAFWNAPVDRPDHARAAARAALRMQAGLAELNSADPGADPLEVGIGINTGPCIVGNMGSAMRFDYTALGDTVNLASRLEGQSVTYGTGIILGDTTARALGDAFAVLELDLLRVKGKSEPEHIHALLGDAALARRPGFATLRAANRRMLAAYRGQDVARASRALDEVAAAARTLPFALDTYIALYGARLDRMRQAPHPADWDGAETALLK